MPEDISEHRKNNKTFDSNGPIDVICAIIEKNGQVLAARRGAAMTMLLKWELTGGKINPGETAEECVMREIKEELGIAIQIKTMLPPSSHSCPDLHVREFVPFDPADPAPLRSAIRRARHAQPQSAVFFAGNAYKR
ncbi:8-oxo-dGTP pyrophosphatase MutT (NUDIX family) [Desulfosalsimonas propionicica]|uniref:8-oxo-dGTP diphosphatase n=1 Tax=Desulfosalsimonas propionicica TaxID=332175 RepID=A0A7W0C6X7_9BACT|nr:NUDIX domain-containing protein [Desulfosalsimonas propionicica]MBA2880222.1 8-oxo-dGTP pyrophosphatase MutT (NUDIX family) [Desulfosalsimonas propionicica]